MKGLNYAEEDNTSRWDLGSETSRTVNQRCDISVLEEDIQAVNGVFSG
jgi:hypothetical protein